jgi:quaternary ammonium compound-resistance protein SugE
MSTAMAWLILIIGGLFETGWAVGLKYTEGFTRFWPSVGTLAAMLISVWLLAIAMKVLPLGSAYAVWVGVGAVGAVIIGIMLFGDPASWPRLASVALIIAGIIGLKLFS